MTTYARRLGVFSATMAVVGGIIGGGIFRTLATVAERLRSPGLVLLAWIIGGVVALIGAFCFGELGQRRPRAGGGYVYLRETWGALPAFLYGWTLVLIIATGAIAAVAVTFADYTLALLGLPHRFSIPLAAWGVGCWRGSTISACGRPRHNERLYGPETHRAGVAYRVWSHPYRPLPPLPAPTAVSTMGTQALSSRSLPTADGANELHRGKIVEPESNLPRALV
jgi:amino acid transporter